MVRLVVRVVEPGLEPESTLASQKPRRMSPSSAVMPRDPSIEGQHWCSIIRIASQHLGPRCVSPLIKNSTTSPLQDWSSNIASQQEDDPSSSNLRRAKRVDVDSSLRARARVDTNNKVSITARRLEVQAIVDNFPSFKVRDFCAWEILNETRIHTYI